MTILGPRQRASPNRHCASREIRIAPFIPAVVRVLSKLRQVSKTGKMRIEIRMNEPGIVAIAGNIRPGVAVKKSRKGSRKLIKVPQVMLAYRKAGKLVVTMKLSRSARTALGRAKNAKMSVGTIAVDVFKNQDSGRKKLKIKR